MYLVLEDYHYLVRKEVLDCILDEAAQGTTLTAEQVRIKAERYAENLMKGYLCAAYDVDAMFTPYVVYDASKAYAETQFIYDDVNYKFYTAIQDAPIGTLLTDELFFTEGDTRNDLLINFMVDITLFELHKSINPRNIPDLRGIARDEAIDYMKMSIDPRNNMCPPGFILQEFEDGEGNDIIWGSNKRRQHGQDCY